MQPFACAKVPALHISKPRSRCSLVCAKLLLTCCIAKFKPTKPRQDGLAPGRGRACAEAERGGDCIRNDCRNYVMKSHDIHVIPSRNHNLACAFLIVSKLAKKKNANVTSPKRLRSAGAFHISSSFTCTSSFDGSAGPSMSKSDRRMLVGCNIKK